MLTTIAFVEHLIDVPNQPSSPRAVEVGDFSNANRHDLLVLYRTSLSVYQPSHVGATVHDRVDYSLSTDGGSLFAFNMVLANLDNDNGSELLATVPNFVSYQTPSDNTLAKPQVIQETDTIRDDIIPTDLDGDGDLDVVSGRRSYENVNGILHVRSEGIDVPGVAAIHDLNDDGRSDVVLRDSETLAWCRNEGAFKLFDDCHVVLTGWDNLFDVTAFDADADGDPDLVFASGGLGWIENTDGKGTYAINESTHSFIAVPGGQMVEPADLDGDGDLDLLFGTRDLVGWLETTDEGLAEYPHLVGEIRIPRSYRDVAKVYDIDGDADLDVFVAGTDSIVWYERRIFGDSDDNGVFDSEDLATVFAAGKYNDDSAKTTFDEGDWNQDGVFDEQDIVKAFIEGHYQSGNAGSTSVIAAAIDAAHAEDQK